MIEDIQSRMGALFSSRKLEPFTIQLNLADMAKWAERITDEQQLDRHNFQGAIKELFWALGSTQLNIGHTLIAMKECPYPNGTKGMALKGGEIPDTELADLHYWHHLYNSYEALYRFWERCVAALKMRLTPRIKEKYYFDGYVNYLSNHSDILPPEEITKIRRYLKAWGNISCRRNEISHGKSNPFLNMNIDVTFSELSDYLGKPIAKYKYELPNLKQEIETVINYYKKSVELLYLVKNICDLEIEPSKETHSP
jgi:hypothetical protein